MQIEKCKLEAIYQNGYQSSQDILHFTLCNLHSAITARLSNRYSLLQKSKCKLQNAK